MISAHQTLISSLRAFLISTILLFYSAAPLAAKGSEFNIAFLTDGPEIRYSERISELKREILELTSGEFNVVFPPGKHLNGNWEINLIKNSLRRLLEDPEVDLLITIGAISSSVACKTETLPKPVIASTIIDASLQKLPGQKGIKRRKNLSYINTFSAFDRDINKFRELVKFSNLTIMTDKLVADSIPELRRRIGPLEKSGNIKVDFIEVEKSAKKVLTEIPPSSEAVFLTPLVRLSDKEFKELTRGLIEKKLPSFSTWGGKEVKTGVLAGLASDSDKDRLIRRVAIYVQRILLGEKPESLETEFQTTGQLTINMETARKINIYPSWATINSSIIVDDEFNSKGSGISLESAVREALIANLDLAAAGKKVSAGKQDVNKAFSDLLPQITIGASGVRIDGDRANNFLYPAENTVYGNATASQILWSDKAFTNYSVQKQLYKALVEEKNSTSLNIALESATAFLNVLQAGALEKIQQDNLKLTMANLKRANVRRRIGLGSPSEVFRWESEIALSRKALIDSQAQHKQARNALNRILNRPVATPFIAEDVSLNDPFLIISDKKIFSLVNNPGSFSIFQDFMVEEAISNSPELKRLEAAMKARKKIYSLYKRAHFMPTIAMQGKYTETLDESGDGSDSGPPAPFSSVITETDDSDWSVGIDISFPFFTSGKTSAERKGAKDELLMLNLEKKSSIEKIDEKMRFLLHKVSASYNGIELVRASAKAAGKNLNLVADAYSRGVVSIVDLIDAQNAALVSDQLAAAATYDFLIDLMRVQRLSGKFTLSEHGESHRDFINRFEHYLKKRRDRS